MQVSTHDQDTPAANKQHKIEDQLPEYFNHGRIKTDCFFFKINKKEYKKKKKE